MPEECNHEKLAVLTAKIAREARFTRVMVVICMFATVVVNMYTFSQINAYMPTLVVNEYMGQLDKIYDMWKANENIRWQKVAPQAAKVHK